MSRLFLCVSTLLLQAAFAQPVEWTIDTAHSAAQFSVRHLMISNVRGHFGKITGKVVFDPKNVAATSIDASIDVTSVNTREVKRDAHLKSPDFFDVEKYPAMTFKSKRAEAAGAGRVKVIGDLTLHGVTKEVTLDVEGPSPELKDAQGRRVGASATTKISRKDFGMTWNRAIETGGVVVGDEVAVTIDVELRAAAASGG